MKKLFHKIYWTQANLTGDAAGENLCVCVRKTSMFGDEELHPILETPKLILTFIQTIDIGLKQMLMKNLILAEKSTTGILCVFKSFQYIYVFK